MARAGASRKQFLQNIRNICKPLFGQTKHPYVLFVTRMSKVPILYVKLA